ncbi:MAG: single-stranded DNA-binding protein [Pseudomonadota bacterium]
MVNKVILVGNLGADPEVRYTPSGTKVTSFRIATSERRKDKEGNWQEHTEWHPIVTFGKLADVCGEHLFKGKQVYVEGRLQTRSWEDRDGQKKYRTEIIASDMRMLGSKGGGKPSEGASGGNDFGDPAPDDDIPF